MAKLSKKEETDKRVEMSARFLKSASAVLEAEGTELGSAVESCFQAIEKLVEAMLFHKTGNWSTGGKHSRNISNFKKLFVATNEIQNSVFETYQRLFDLRGERVYDFAELLIGDANDLYEDTQSAREILIFYMKRKGWCSSGQT